MSPAKVLLGRDADLSVDRRQVRWGGDRLPVTNPARYQCRTAFVRRCGAFRAVPR